MSAFNSGVTYSTIFFLFRSCPSHLEAGLTKVVLEETRNHYLNPNGGGPSSAVTDHATAALEQDVMDSPAMPLAVAGGRTYRPTHFAA